MVRKIRLVGVMWGLLAVTSSTYAAENGRVSCDILENGESASGTITLERDGKRVAQGTCGGDPLAVPGGTYTAILSLDGALDAPQQRQGVEIAAGKLVGLKADFATATLKVMIQQEGRRAAGMAVIRRDGKQIGTLGSGVSVHLSAGTYEITARYHAQQKDFGAVRLAAGEAKELEASFP